MVLVQYAINLFTLSIRDLDYDLDCGPPFYNK